MRMDILKQPTLWILLLVLFLSSASFLSRSIEAQKPSVSDETTMTGGGASHSHGISAIGSPSADTPCPTCGGTGEVMCPNCNGTGGEKPCTWCGGTGFEECPTCHGTGRCFACNGTGECQACDSWYAVYDTPCPSCGGTGLCGVCDGTGVCYACDGQGGKTCWRCGGTGREGKCPRCGGTGTVQCPDCSGTGTITEDEETPPAVMTLMEGDVKVMRNGEEVTTTPLFLRPEDEIRTGDDSAAEIEFLDGTLVRISQNCCLTYRKLVEEVTKEETFWGRVWGRIQGEAWRIWCEVRGKPWRIDGPGFGMAVRGTEFTVEVAQDGTATLTVLVGTIEFSDPSLTTSVLVGDWQTSTIAPGGTPSTPVTINSADIDRWWQWEEETVAEIPPTAKLFLAIIVALVTVGKALPTHSQVTVSMPVWASPASRSVHSNVD